VSGAEETGRSGQTWLTQPGGAGFALPLPEGILNVRFSAPSASRGANALLAFHPDTSFKEKACHARQRMQRIAPPNELRPAIFLVFPDRMSRVP
jgi:hypothetical protein